METISPDTTHVLNPPDINFTSSLREKNWFQQNHSTSKETNTFVNNSIDNLFDASKVKSPIHICTAHRDEPLLLQPHKQHVREERELHEHMYLAPGSTLSLGAGKRSIPEKPDEFRTCFERDRDRILHASAFRRLAGKTQVFLWPTDNQRTRLTHALEVTQIATTIARNVGVNVALVEAIALGHDCGHGPGGHAAEDAFSPYLPDGFDHALWGANVVLTSLNLCEETLDGIRNHSWSRPSPSTPEALIVSWADRIAYTAHDFEDAVSANIVQSHDLPQLITRRCGTSRSQHIDTFVRGITETICATGIVGMEEELAETLHLFRTFNAQYIYFRKESQDQSKKIISVLRGLVDYFFEHPEYLPASDQHQNIDFMKRSRPHSNSDGDASMDAIVDLTSTNPEIHRVRGTKLFQTYFIDADDNTRLHRIIAYVASMTDRYAFTCAKELLGNISETRNSV